MKKTADITIIISGIAMIYGSTKRGIKWLKSNASFEPWQVQEGGIACEPRMALEIKHGATSDGLHVSMQ